MFTKGAGKVSGTESRIEAQRLPALFSFLGFLCCRKGFSVLSEKLSPSEKLRLSKALLRGVQALRKIISANPPDDPFADCEALASEGASIAKRLNLRSPLWAEAYQERDGRRGLCREIHVYYPTGRGKVFILAPYSSLERQKELLAEAQHTAIHALERWELFLKLSLQALKEQVNLKSQQAPRKRPGRKINPAQREWDALLAREWEAARAAGITKKEFAQQVGISFRELEKILDREGQRRRRAAKK